MKTKPKQLPPKKERVGEARDILDAIGHENEKEGIRWTQYFMDKWDRQQWKKNQLYKEKLDNKRRRSRIEYHKLIANILNQELQDLDVPFGYKAWAKFDQRGVVVNLIDRYNTKFYRAFKPDGTPKIDFTAIMGLLLDVQEKIDEKQTKFYESLQTHGFVLPS